MMKAALIAVALGIAALAMLAMLAALGASRWTAGTRARRARLEAARMPVEPTAVDFRELEGLPAPVQRYFRTALQAGQPMIAGVRMRHRGRFNVGEATDAWKPFVSDQRVVARRPGFDWEARIGLMPGLTLRVHDAYVAGEGVLQAALLGLFTVADLRGTRALAEGELMRFLAEAVWYPTALLPSQGVCWDAVDARSARATLVDGAVSAALVFAFDDSGMISTVQAEARGRSVGREIVPTPWHGRFWNYQARGGLQVPLEGEVAWLLPQGARPYWRGHIVDIDYAFAA